MIQQSPRKGRELMLSVLCHVERHSPQARQAQAELVLESPPRGTSQQDCEFAELAANAAARGFAEELLAVLFEQWVAVDQMLSEASKRWRLERMDMVDRNILRIATTELMFVRSRSKSVVVSEAVRLAKLYGGARSIGFVNGVAETVAGVARPEANDGSESV